MTSILFIDDDPDVLNGLKDLLRVHRREWDMRFAGSGEEGLALLEEGSFDVVVSDMRMPVMDGATVLRLVKERHPRTIRIVLSGQTELEVAMRTVSIAHQFLSKPCEAEQLRGVIGRACDLRNILTSSDLQSLVGGIAQLPSAPRTYQALDRLLGAQNTSMKEVARVIEMDVAMCAKILQLVNSAFFGLPRRITSIVEATTYLGTLMLRHLALSMGAFSAFERDNPSITAVAESLQRHSILTAHLARGMFTDKRLAQDAFMAGMLHGIGNLILLASPGPTTGASIRPALVGAYLLGLWGIPYSIVEAVAHHDSPSAVDHTVFDLPDAVHLAHHLASELVGISDGHPASGELDVLHLARVGITTAQVAQWRASGAEIARGGAI